MLNILNIVWSWIAHESALLWRAFIWLWNNLVGIAQFLWGWVKALRSGVVFVARSIFRGLKALGHLKFRSIWNAIKRGVDRIRRAYAWYMRRIQAPLDKIRQRIWEIYRRFFQPIVRALDSLRVFIRFIAIFNRKLAAKLDARLWDLESKLLSPITIMLRRVNSISSQMRAIQTRLGFLDRALLLESLRRDASLVLEVLTNPRGRIHSEPQGVTHRTMAEVDVDFDVYARTGAGPLAEQLDELDRVHQETKVVLGV